MTSTRLRAWTSSCATLNVARGVVFRPNDHVATHFEAGTAELGVPEAIEQGPQLA